MRSIFNKQMIGPLIFLLFGLFFFAIGSGLTMRQRTLERQGIEAPGVVVALQENYDSDGSTYTPVVQFKTASGQNIEFSSSYSSSPPDYDVGEPVIVVYPSALPDGMPKPGYTEAARKLADQWSGDIAFALDYVPAPSSFSLASFLTPFESF